jgi:hypothetical protein
VEKATLSSSFATARVIASPTALSTDTLASAIDSFESETTFATFFGASRSESPSGASEGIGSPSATHATVPSSTRRGTRASLPAMLIRRAPERRSTLSVLKCSRT